MNSTDRRNPTDGTLAGFDPSSGNWLERLLFNNRLAIVLLCLAVTFGLGRRSGASP